MLEQFSQNMKQQVGLTSPKTREERIYEQLDEQIGRNFQPVALFQPDPDVLSNTSTGVEQNFSWLIKYLREVKKLNPEDTALALAYIKKKSLEAIKNNGKELKRPI